MSRDWGPLLVVSHEASRTGAPQVLAVILRALRSVVDRGVVVRQITGGVREHEFDQLATLADGPHDFAAVLLNTVVSVSELHRIDSKVPVLLYIHEEGSGIDAISAQDRHLIRERVDLVYTVSERAKSQLLSFGVVPERVSVVPPPVVIASPAESVVEGIRSRFGPSPLIVGCGVVGWRKGTDLFVEILARLSLSRDVTGLWVGRSSAVIAARLVEDANRLGLATSLHLIGEVADAAPFLAAADIVVMPSREDPQPLVPAEAALLGTPTVGFDVGGIGDYAERGFAAVAPYPDIDAVARAVDCLLDPGSDHIAERFSEWLRRERSVDRVISTLVTDLTKMIGKPL